MLDLDDFVPVSEDMPPPAKPYKFVTADVEIVLEDGSVVIGYYDYRQYEFRLSSNSRIIKTRAIAWRDL